MNTTAWPEAQTAPRPAQAPPDAPSRTHRLDIQGLRGVAVLLVLAYHAGVPWFGGGYVGVDVFFVVSGFLITGLIVREVEHTGRLDLPRFWARRIRRLLPASAAVLLATIALTLLALPSSRWLSVLGDVAAASLYVVNWRLADSSTDYLAAEQAASPVQHFWSLAVEEQFYLLWPLLVLACILVCRRTGRTIRSSLLVVLTAVAVPSLLWSVWLTSQSPGPAYFVTTTRLWELAVGALLAVTGHRLASLRRGVAVGLGWSGAAAIAAAALLFSEATPFPGSTALLPVLGTAAVLAAGISDPTLGVGRLLGWRPLTQVGDLSYPLYLWHWPLVAVGTAVFAPDDGDLWWVTGVLLVSTAVVPAWFTATVLERPLHHNALLLRRRFAVLTLVLCVLLPLGAATAVQQALGGNDPSGTASSGDLPEIGAVLLAPDPASSPAGETPSALGETTPDLVSAGEDNPEVYEQGCHVEQDAEEPEVCTWGETGADTKVALVGDSHAAHWQPALRWIAEQRGWQLDAYTKSSCGWFDATVARTGGDRYEECQAWNDRVDDLLLEGGYDTIITSSDGGSEGYTVISDGRELDGSESDDVLARGTAEAWQRAETAGIDVVALTNTPRMSEDIPECLASHDDPGSCSRDRESALEEAGTVQADAAEEADDIDLIDLNDWICPRSECSPVIGSAIVFRDAHHLTATYSRSLAPALADQLDEVGQPS